MRDQSSRPFRRHLSYANVTATLALVFAMTGGALAANHYLLTSTKQISPKVLKQLTNQTAAETKLFKKLAATATVAKANFATTAGTATNATHAATATSATDATNATHADAATTATTAANATNATNAITAVSATDATSAVTAGNANALGGVSASGYTRNDCSSTTGQIKGFAIIPSSASFSSSFVNLATAYNCSGEAVQAKRISTGEYEVKFLGNGSAIAMGTDNDTQCGGVPCPDFVSVDGSGGDFLVAVTNTDDNAVDGKFDLVVP
jgi:hypothetical protein